MQQSEMHEKKEQMEEKSAEAVGRVKGSAKSMIDKRRMQAADNLGSVARAFRRSSEELSKEDATASRYTDFAAKQAEHLAAYLREGDIDQAMDKVERFARKRPEVFLGGAFAIGFFLSRFIKSSRPGGGYEAGGEYEEYQYGRYARPSYGASATRGEWTKQTGETVPAREGPIPTAPGVGPT
jgi:hypothetical protein